MIYNHVPSLKWDDKGILALIWKFPRSRVGIFQETKRVAPDPSKSRWCEELLPPYDGNGTLARDSFKKVLVKDLTGLENPCKESIVLTGTIDKFFSSAST